LRCGGLHNAAIIKNCLYVWGRGDAGQLGLPLNLGFEISTPTKV
jgi:alpha-tubulin suppressor-like RCC1 family protein